MRILSGDFKNRAIETPKQANTRPTSSKLRAQLFNICQQVIEESRFMDICAGSGAMGLEAISRGAAHALFIDHDADAIRTVKKNISLLHVEEKSRVVFSDAVVALKKLESEILQGKVQPFDIIFFDPPYFQKEVPASFSFVQEVLAVMSNPDNRILKPGGLFFVEESRFSPIETLFLPSLTLLSRRGTGDSCLFEFQRKE